MAAKKLHLFNGRWMEGRHGCGHAYVAANSRADAARVITEALGREPRGVLNELKVYWSHGAWGDSMAGIKPERGIWVQQDRHSKPARLLPAQPGTPAEKP
jgi:hypothetical protein